MSQSNEQVNIYRFLTPLLFSAFFFFSSFYLCMLEVSAFIYMLPLYAFFLLVSLYLFFQTDREINNLKEETKATINQYAFYHNCIGIYLLLSFILFGVSVAYLPFYHHGGRLFVWYCLPLSFLCLISYVQSKKRLKSINDPSTVNTGN
ncbi:MAG: hypothetical protein Q8898_13970 [Bacillota bacterium]|nr:hypothetical protein [Bacillota bacterium]